MTPHTLLFRFAQGSALAVILTVGACRTQDRRPDTTAAADSASDDALLARAEDPRTPLAERRDILKARTARQVAADRTQPRDSVPADLAGARNGMTGVCATIFASGASASSQPVRVLTAAAATDLGLPAGTPVAGTGRSRMLTPVVTQNRCVTLARDPRVVAIAMAVMPSAPPSLNGVGPGSRP